MKIAINISPYGFSLSKEAYRELGLIWDTYGFAYSTLDKRADEKLIGCIEKLGLKASGICSEIWIIEIPDGMNYIVKNLDGVETVYPTL